MTVNPEDFDRFAREAFRYDKPPRCLITPFGVFLREDDTAEVEVMDYDDDGNLYAMNAEDREAALRAFAEMLEIERR